MDKGGTWAGIYETFVKSWQFIFLRGKNLQISRELSHVCVRWELVEETPTSVQQFNL